MVNMTDLSLSPISLLVDWTVLINDVVIKPCVY
jgi:hypothetical protein